MLPFAARQHFLEHGWSLARNALNPSTVSLLRAASLAAASARWKQLCDIPSIDVIFQRRQSKFSDPPLQHLVTHLEKRRFLLRYFRMIRRQRREQRKMIEKLLNGQKKEDLSEEEICKLSVLLQKEMLKKRGRSSIISCDRTIHNDPQMLQAISEYRANLWMTHQPLESLLRSAAVAEVLGKLAEEIGGVDKPVLFGDAPLVRDAFGGGIGYQCTAPLFGTRTTKSRRNVAVTFIPFTFTPSTFCLEPHAIIRPCTLGSSFSSFPLSRDKIVSSHHIIRSFLSDGGGDKSNKNSKHHRSAMGLLHELSSPFLLNEYHIPFQLQRLFRFGLPSETTVRNGMHPEQRTVQNAEEKEWRGESFISLCSSSPLNKTDENCTTFCRECSIAAGDVLIVDPHLLVAFGPNLTASPEVVYRLNIVSETAKPFMGSPSWIRGWRSLPQEVSFGARTVFPPLNGTDVPP